MFGIVIQRINIGTLHVPIWQWAVMPSPARTRRPGVYSIHMLNGWSRYTTSEWKVCTL